MLAEPGGDLDASLIPPASPPPPPMPIARPCRRAAEGQSRRHRWRAEEFRRCDRRRRRLARLPAAAKQQLRDNIFTLLGQAGESRKPFTKAQAESIRTPTLFIGGGNTTGSLATVHRVLAQHVATSQTAMIDGAKHWMFDDAPQEYCEAVLEFLAE